MNTPPGSNDSYGETEAAFVLAGETILSQDNVPDENQQLTCFSCGETLTGLYCHACGQKNDDFRRSIFSLAAETFASFFSLDNRMWRSWAKLLLKPGQVARDFADGKRTSWTSPVRMYLAPVFHRTSTTPIACLMRLATTRRTISASAPIMVPAFRCFSASITNRATPITS